MLRAFSAWTARRAVPLAALGVVTSAGITMAAPANNACPAAFETISVDQAVADGYLTSPVTVDNAGNHDRVVCRQAVGGPPGSFQVYIWQDNATPRNV
jgi:hypothetical protein